MILEASPGRVFRVHVALIFLLLGANILGILSRLYFGYDQVVGFIRMFDFNLEKNIPAIFSSIMLFVCSALLSLIAISSKKLQSSYIPWVGLSLIFLFLSFDELFAIHERLVVPTREAFETTGFLYYAWVIPYGVALITFVVAYSRFLMKLPRNIARLFLLSGFIFVSGAIGFELLAGPEAEAMRKANILYCTYYTCEELLEMLGIAIFLYALLRYFVSEFESLRIVIANND